MDNLRVVVVYHSGQEDKNDPGLYKSMPLNFVFLNIFIHK
jgi:hypothetical protein